MRIGLCVAATAAALCVLLLQGYLLVLWLVDTANPLRHELMLGLYISSIYFSPAPLAAVTMGLAFRAHVHTMVRNSALSVGGISLVGTLAVILHALLA